MGCLGDPKFRLLRGSGSPTFLINFPEVLRDRRPIVAIASDGGIDCLSKDIRVRVDTYAVQQWIKATVGSNWARRQSCNSEFGRLAMHPYRVHGYDRWRLYRLPQCSRKLRSSRRTTPCGLLSAAALPSASLTGLSVDHSGAAYVVGELVLRRRRLSVEGGRVGTSLDRADRRRPV